MNGSTLPVDRLPEFCGLRIVDDVGDDVFGLAEVVLGDGGEGGESEG